MGRTDGWISSCGGTRMRAALCLGTTFCVAAAVSTGAAAKAHREAFRFPAAKVHGQVVTFELSGLEPGSIRRAFVRQGDQTRHITLHRVRAAARRGWLRVRRHTRRKATLVVIANPPPPAPAGTTTPGTTTPGTTTPGTTTKPAAKPGSKPAPKPAPAPAPSPGPVTTWRAPGSPPLSDAAARALVTPRAEIRPENTAANHYVPTAAELAAFHSAGSFNPLERYVTGGFNGTTDEILQWGAHKWGIPEDIERAVAVTESWWRQSGMGDRADGVNAALYPAQSRIDANSVYQTLGIMQIKWAPDGSLHPGTEPLRWKSTAFSVDYWSATVRYYYDGLCNWCGSGYSAGQAWQSVGAHYDPYPWANSGMMHYIGTVQAHVADRTWAQPGF